MMRVRRLIMIFAFVIMAMPAFAQHPCDQTYPASGSVQAGTSVPMKFCHTGTDANGTPVTTWRLYANGALVGPVTPTKGATANAAGKFEYTFTITAPATAVTVTYDTTAGNSAGESAHSSPFALTATLPPTVPGAPSNFHVVVP